MDAQEGLGSAKLRLPAAPSDTDVPMRPSAWLAHLQLLANLPYPLEVLMPSVLYTLRQGLRADYGSFTPLEPRTLRSGAIYAERFAPEMMGWLCAARETAQAAHSTEMMVRSDGESRRALCLASDFEDNPLYRHLLQPLGTRWSMTAPLLDAKGDTRGLLYLHRSAAHGPFSDAEQALLRRARNVLQPLALPRQSDAPEDGDIPRVGLRQASVVIDGRGRFIGVGDGARELLYRCAKPGPGETAWLTPGVEALPAPVMDDVLNLLWAARRGTALPQTAPRRLRGQAGEHEFRLEPLGTCTGRPGTMVVVHVRHLEPTDITLARRLTHWKLSPQERRMLITALRHPDQHALAERLGISLHTLKSYSTDMVRRHGFASRQKMTEAVLRRPLASCEGAPAC